MNKEEREESWNFVDLMADYKRMGVPNNLWVTTAANSEYRVSHILTCASVKIRFRYKCVLKSTWKTGQLLSLHYFVLWGHRILEISVGK